jgi:SAM-dependent methyltransferase
MSDRVRTTHATYDEVAADFLANTRDRSRTRAWLDRFAERLPEGARVLDLGAGPGCDSSELRHRGLSPISVDLSLGMLRAGLSDFPGPRVQADLQRLPFRADVALGFWANASLLHLDPDALGRALREVDRVCVPGAIGHVALKRGTGAEWESGRYGRPRWFQYWSAADFEAQLGAAGWRIAGAWEDSTRRDDWLIWLVVVGAGAPES